MSFSEMTIDEFSKALASKAPVPGGGGAAALCGSLAASLGLMVGRLTVDKAKYAPNEMQLRELMEKSEALRLRLLELADRDAEVFLPLSEAYKLSSEAPQKEAVMEKCLEAAARVPLEILECCCEIIKLQERFAALGSRLAVSDAGAGAVLAWGGMYAAALNVLANTHEMRDREKAQRLNEQVDTLMDEYWRRADKVYEDIYTTLRNGKN